MSNYTLFLCHFYSLHDCRMRFIFSPNITSHHSAAVSAQDSVVYEKASTGKIHQLIMCLLGVVGQRQPNSQYACLKFVCLHVSSVADACTYYKRPNGHPNKETVRRRNFSGNNNTHGQLTPLKMIRDKKEKTNLFS